MVLHRRPAWRTQRGHWCCDVDWAVPLRPAIALALATCAITQLVLVLVLYPAMSLLGGRGDFVGIYLDAPRPASLTTGVGHAASLLAFRWPMDRAWMRGFLASPVPRPWRLRWAARP